MVLQHAGGNQSEASRILGITRGSLRNKIRTHGISIDQVVTLEN
jgi:two-component system nitrogen regulation response regulator GlnG